MMRVLGAVCLALVVIGVIYLSQSRSKDRQTQAFSEGLKKGSVEVSAQKKHADSLAARYQEERQMWRDSVALVRAQSDTVIDSLTQRVEQQSDQIQKYAAELKKRPKTKSLAKSPTTQTNRHKEILSYYKNRYETLPKDLSEYEMRVALTEIREETATKFAISVADLETIRRNNGLTY